MRLGIFHDGAKFNNEEEIVPLCRRAEELEDDVQLTQREILKERESKHLGISRLK